MEIKTWKEVIDDIPSLGGSSPTKVFYLTFQRLRIERGDEDYIPTPIEVMNELCWTDTQRGPVGLIIKSIFTAGLLSKEYYEKYKRTILLDGNGMEIPTKTGGIYAIKCDTGVYIGLSIDIHSRLRTHLAQIKKGYHKYIGRDENAEIYVLEECENRSELHSREVFHARRALALGLNLLNEQNFNKEDK